MYLKIFTPVFFLLLLQIIAFLIYGGFILNVSNSVFFLVIFGYLAILISIIITKNHFGINGRLDRYILNKNIKLISIFIILFFLLRPIVVMIGISSTLGQDYIRYNFFYDKQLQIQIFGSIFMSSFTLSYIIPISWFLVVLLIGSKDKLGVILFYIFLLALVVFNASYAGRFNMYFALLMIYFRSVYIGDGFNKFFLKNSYIFIFVFIYSFFILFIRQNKNSNDFGYNDLLMLLEYHILQPFFLSQKIMSSEIVFEGFPFKVVLTSFFAPIYYILGFKGDSIPISYYPQILNDYTLYSQYTGSIYNAYATFMAYFYIDFGFFYPLAIVFSWLVILVFSLMIKSKELRVLYLIFISFSLYASLFQAFILSTGAMLIIGLFPIICRLSEKYILRY